MVTECNKQKLLFESHGRREVSAAFDGGTISSDGGGLLLREVEERFGILRQFAKAFTDHRKPDAAEFTCEQLIRQRVMGIALGYEDLNDHEQLRHDPLLALMCGRKDVTGKDRGARSKGVPLAGKSTLNRLELTPAGAKKNSRYKKIVASIESLQNTLVDVFIRMRNKQGRPTELVLDLDATDDPVHGDQLGKFFHGYYKSYCFLPLYTFCGGWPLGAVLRPSNIDGCAGTVKELRRIVPKLRAAWPGVKIIIRADSGFCRDEILSWCEDNDVDYIIGLAKNKRLTKIIGGELQQALKQFEATDAAARVFKDFSYRTQKSWSCERRVIGKAEHLPKGANPRFVVTSLPAEEVDARALYEDRYCARGEMENRIKEQQLYLFADRTSTHNMRSNQLRLLFSTMAYLLHHVLREFGLAATEMEKAQAGTIRAKLLKIGAKIQVTVRRVVISLSESYPYQDLFNRILMNLRGHEAEVMQL